MPQKPGCMANLARFFIGVTIGFPFLVLFFLASWEGYFPSLFFSLFFALGARWTVLGLMGLAKPLPPRKITYGVALGVAALMTLAGPMVSRSYNVKNELKVWEEVEGSDKVWDWHENYMKNVPEPFRRPGWASRYAEVRCREAFEQGNYPTLREVAQEVFVDKDKIYDAEVKKTVEGLYKELFAKGLASIKPTKLADPKMSSAFKAALEAIASNPTRRMLVKFDSKGTPGPLAEDKAMLSGLAPEYAKLPVTAVGDALSANAESRRAGAAISAMQSSFDAVVPKDLANLEPAPDKPEPKDVLFEIDADVKRLPGFYVNSVDDKPNGFLYKLEVYWKFRVTVDGKSLGEFAFRSEPAKSVSYQTQDTDPQWAPYSIMMDSATDNFARLVIGKLGMEPPAEKTSYVFTPNTTAAPAPQAPVAAPTP